MAFDPVQFNAESVIQAALGDIGVVSLEDGQVVSPAQGQDGLRRLNAMISSWSIHRLAIPFISREVFNVVANQSTYTIGPGGDFDTIRPVGLTGAALLLNASSPPVEIPNEILTDDAYEAIPIKDLTNTLWTKVYYNAEYQGGLASIFLWPTPTTSDNDLVLYRGDLVQGFTNMTTSQSFPPGYFEAFEYQLALRLSIPYGQTPSNELRMMASQAFSTIKRENYKWNDAAIDPAMTNDRRGWYNLLTGTGGGS